MIKETGVMNSKRINFTDKFKIFGVLSAILVTISVVLFFSKGLNYGVDFAGGTEIQVKIDGMDTDQLRKIVSKFGKVDLQKFEGKDNEFLLRFPNISMVDDITINKFIDAVKGMFPEANLTKKHFDSQVGDRIEMWFDKPIEQEKVKTLFEKYNIPSTGKIEYKRVGERHIYRVMLQGLTNKILTTVQAEGKTLELMRVELVGPKVGKRLRYSAFQAVIYALIAILIYIALRFNYQFAPGAVIALTHDVLITLGIWSIFNLQFDLTIVAALMTIVGYSLNDTIVVYDRIRENWNNPKKGANVVEKINTSLNETITRTLLTSFTTLIVLVALIVFGGGTISGFATAMTLGVIVGTYSSVFIASPVTIFVEKHLNKGKTA